MIEINMLQQLEAFARFGTLSRAAEELHITQPALSRSMRKLEATTGMQLFNRDGKHLSLNKTGEVAVRYARRILEDEDDMLEQMQAMDRRLNGIAFGSCAPLPLARLTPALETEYPEKAITTRMEAEDEVLLRGLHDRKFQIIVLHTQPDDHSLFCQRYIKESLYLYVPTAHPLASKKSVTFNDMAQYQIVVHRHIGFWLGICQEEIPSYNLIIQDNIDSMDALAESSSLAMFNSSAMMEDGYLTDGRVPIPISDPQASTTYYVACLDSEKERYRTFFNTVRSEAMKEK